MRKIRIENKSEALDTLELEWWDKNALMIEKIWKFDDFLSKIIRKSYIKKSKKFLLGEKKQVKVLELGCGSGWVGQFFASKNIFVHGTDFSPNQVDLAKKNSVLAGKQQYTSYAVADSTNSNFDASEYDAVLLHAFIHHLDQPEFDKLFTGLLSKMKSGTKFWFYEPTHVENIKNISISGLNSKLRIALMILGNKTVNTINYLASRLKLNDELLKNQFENETKTAIQNGWYFSPKEIPIESEGFAQTLSSNGIAVSDSYWATGFLIGWANSVALLKNRKLRWFLSNLFIRPLGKIDNWIISDTEFMNRIMKPPSYAFRVWECVKV